jgi:hypothetical protein
MKIRKLAVVGACALLTAIFSARPASAQNVAATGNSEASLAAGTAIYAELSAGLDSKKVKTGDAVTAHVTEAVRSADARTILPKGTKIVGHITQASARSKGGNESVLGIAFDKAILKDGQEVPLNLAIQALAAPASFSTPSDLGTQSNNGTTQTSPMGRSGPPAQTGPQGGVGSGNNPGLGGDTSRDTSPSLGASSRGVYGLNGL